MKKLKEFYKNNKEKINKFLNIALTIYAIVLLILCISFLIIDKANAEELKENQFISFNQYAKEFNSENYRRWNNDTSGNIQYVNSNLIRITPRVLLQSNYNYGLQTTYQINYKSGHKYIIACDIIANYNFGLSIGIESNVNYNKGIVKKYGDNTYYEMFTHDGNDANRLLLIYLGNNFGASLDRYVEYSNLQIYDLSQIYGIGNEPTTYEEFRELFKLKYYPYQTNTILNYNYINGYNDGLFAINDGFTIEQASGQFVNEAYPININSDSDFTKSNLGVAWFGLIGINTSYTLLANDTIIINISGVSGDFDICQYGNNGQLETLQHINITELENITTPGASIQTYGGTITIKLKYDTNTILFNGTGIINFDKILYKTFNYSNAIYDSYLNGYNKGKQESYQSGYNDGFNEGFTSNPNNALKNGWQFVRNVFGEMGGILGIELLPSIPLWTFIAIPLLLGIIAFVYRMGGK